MIVAKYPSLETKWLHKHAPWMPQPKVVFSRLKDASGLYYRPERGVFLSNGIDRSNGVIVVDPDKHIIVDAVIAHEWRHHYQHFHGPYKKGPSWYDLSDKYSYKEAIIKYFVQSPTEMDSFIFQIKHGKDKDDEMWLEWIVKETEGE